jgi:hypothetical protein
MEDLAPPHYRCHLQIERAYRTARSWADEVNDGYANFALRNRDVDPAFWEALYTPAAQALLKRRYI